jgi:hypothetical protein
VADGPPGSVFRDEPALTAARLPAPDVVLFEDLLRASGDIDPTAPGVRDADGLVALLERSARAARIESRGDVRTGAA